MARKRRGLLLGTGLGWLLGYLLDPQSGKRRRTVGWEWTLARFRRAWRRGERAGRYATSTAAGKAEAALHQEEEGKPTPDDTTLADRVRSVVFRDAGVTKGQVSVNAENGVVYLRGEVPDRSLVEELVARTREVQGVRGVENLLHLPGEQAPMHSS
jgi:osmotically-inducible protein OsmY